MRDRDDAPASNPPAWSVLTVSVAELMIAWPLEVVLEVIRMVAVDELPGAPGVISGVVDVRGRTVPVLDLRHRLGLAPRATTLDDRLVSVTTAHCDLLVHVDAVHELRSLDPAAIEPLRGDLAATPHLTGLARAPEGMLFVQDADAFLTHREAADLAAVLAVAANS